MMGHDHPMEAGRWITQDEWNVAQERIRELETEIGRQAEAMLMDACMERDMEEMYRKDIAAKAEKLRDALKEVEQWLKPMLTTAPDSLSRVYDTVAKALEATNG